MLYIDAWLNIENLNKRRLHDINRLSPFGLDNQEPNFMDADVSFLNLTKFGINNRHFKGFVKKNNRIISVIGYNLGHKLKTNNHKIKSSNSLINILKHTINKIKIKNIIFKSC